MKRLWMRKYVSWYILLKCRVVFDLIFLTMWSVKSALMYFDPNPSRNIKDILILNFYSKNTVDFSKLLQQTNQLLYC